MSDGRAPTTGYRTHFEGEVWDQPLTEWERGRIDRIAAEIPADVRTVLDVGCGDGRLTHVLADRGLDVTGTDGSPKALERVRAPKKLCDVDALDFPDAAFDLVLCTEVLEHLPDDVHARALAELRRVSRRYVLVTVPNAEPLELAYVDCPRCRHVFHAYGHVRSYTPAAVESLLPGAERVLVITKDQGPTWHPLLRRLRFDVLRRYSYCATAVCPRCGNADFIRRRRDAARALLTRVNRLLTRGRRRPGGFILCRFRVDPGPSA